ncbi:YtcA family lipoprotein [Orrella sp. 11846]|uniref:YtcA family lipoprotein n=1 Tax=Orrella sp. 11846 TaxID=3409913 RepID=UPI003B5C1073
MHGQQSIQNTRPARLKRLRYFKSLRVSSDLERAVICKISHQPKIDRPSVCRRGCGALMLGIFSFLLSGCSFAQAPAFFMFGSYFPSWLVGSAVSILLVLPLRWILIRTGIDDALPLRLVFYVCLALIMAIGFSYLFSAQ